MGSQISKPTVYAQIPLQGREIRLISLCPSADLQRQLECYCSVYKLDESPEFEALSYVWGAPDPSTDVVILINGESVSIGAALPNALLRLRRINEPRVLWADALCIDQSNTKEKSQQVPMMGGIYSRARRTVIWLGNGDASQIKQVMRAVRLIAQACEEYAGSRTIGTTPTTRYKSVHIPVELFGSEVTQGLRTLYDLPWFWRVWCIQEICLAQDGIVLWGAEEVSWSRLKTAAHWIFDKSVMQDPNDPVVPLVQDIESSHADRLVDARTRRSPLLEVLRDFRERQSTDPRDKVYGLLSLAAPREAAAVEVDYDKSVGQVYATTVLATIRLHSRLTALAFVSHQQIYEPFEDNPSWAPRWDDWRLAMNMGYPEAGCPFAASAGQLMRREDIENAGSPRLALAGILFASVCLVQDVIYPNENNQLGMMHPFLNAARTVLSMENSQEQLQKLARTLHAGEADDGRYVQELDAAAQDAFYGSFKHLIAKMNNATKEELEALSGYEPTSINFRAGAFVTSLFRRVFLTSRGGFGLGPQCMAPGDVVVVLYGGNTPYVLRPCGDDFLFMGQAYMDEIMNGELVRDVEAGKRQAELFHLI
ncbi:heterokaryon incompatibility protein-domain-containing protein [Phaeosphaeria sp. MPI-PUGE-AT-0046c]|nr:heterokaryon incompatibility protein-domain-containing protein [Phaeosphaeria sp. MPI-PUGE-AT-0046c]